MVIGRSMADIIIGIDPDVSKSGVAILDVSARRVEVSSFDFAEMYGYIMEVHRLCEEEGKDLTVVVEAGWLNRTNWHTSWHDKPNVAARKGFDVGRNQQVGHDIITLLRAEAIDVIEVAPLRKCWKGRDRKITHEELVSITRIDKKRTNQEERDAALLVWEYAGLPLRLMVRYNKE